MSLRCTFWQIGSGEGVRVRGKNFWDLHKESQIRVFDIKMSNIEAFQEPIFRCEDSGSQASCAGK